MNVGHAYRCKVCGYKSVESTFYILPNKPAHSCTRIVPRTRRAYVRTIRSIYRASRAESLPELHEQCGPVGNLHMEICIEPGEHFLAAVPDIAVRGLRCVLRAGGCVLRACETREASQASPQKLQDSTCRFTYNDGSLTTGV